MSQPERMSYTPELGTISGEEPTSRWLDLVNKEVVEMIGDHDEKIAAHVGQAAIRKPGQEWRVRSSLFIPIRDPS